MKKYFTTPDFFKAYPHKKVEYEKLRQGRIPAVFVSKKSHSSHKHALDYEEYKKILFTYLDELLEYLIEGNTYHVPYNMGEMYLKKISRKNSNAIDWGNTKKKYGAYNAVRERKDWKFVHHRNDHTGQYTVKFLWNARTTGGSKFKPSRRMWRYMLGRTAKNNLKERLTTDFDIIHQISE